MTFLALVLLNLNRSG